MTRGAKNITTTNSSIGNTKSTRKTNPMTRNYLIESIISSLERLTESVDELSTYTKEEIKIIKVDFEKLISDVKMLKDRPCPRNARVVKEIIEVERLKYNSTRPKEIREIVLWGITIVASIVAIYFYIKNGDL